MTTHFILNHYYKVCAWQKESIAFRFLTIFLGEPHFLSVIPGRKNAPIRAVSNILKAKERNDALNAAVSVTLNGLRRYIAVPSRSPNPKRVIGTTLMNWIRGAVLSMAMNYIWSKPFTSR